MREKYRNLRWEKKTVIWHNIYVIIIERESERVCYNNRRLKTYKINWYKKKKIRFSPVSIWLFIFVFSGPYSLVAPTRPKSFNYFVRETAGAVSNAIFRISSVRNWFKFI